MKHHTLAALTLIITLTLCFSLAHAEDPKTRGEKGDVLTPLAVGNAWVYANDEDDILTTDRIEKTHAFDEKTWYQLMTYEREKGQPKNADEAIEGDLWLAMIDGHECDAFSEQDEDTDELKLTDISRYYRYPATFGDTYKPYADDPIVVMTVIGLNEEVKTKAGTFDCVVYKETSTDDENYTYTSYVAPGIGIIKNITIDDDGTYSSELISYTLVDAE